MHPLLQDILRGQSTRGRSMRSAAFVAIGFGGQNLLRLASNLILTRLLVPEAFGLMALVQVVLFGLQMFSDMGIRLSIIRDDRGEDRDFLNTAWTIQILRGVLLWLISCAIAWPVASIYSEPQLMQLIPVAGISAIILGFQTTKVATANRNLQIGVQMMTELGAQVLGVIFTVTLTFIWRDVWALVLGGLLSNLLKVVLQQRLLPGPNNRLHWDRDIAWSIISFGKYIFIASIAGFMLNQGDRAILGGYVSTQDLGIYSIGLLMAMLPLQLVRATETMIVFPIYRRYPDLSIAENRAKVFRARRLVLAAAIAVSCLLALIGVPLINFLYDPRYQMAGPILTLVSISVGMQIAVSNYDGAYLTHGDSRSLSLLRSLNAVLQAGLLFLGITYFGIPGAALASGIAALITYPYLVRLVRRYGAWDPVTDLLALAACWLAALISLWIWRDEMLALLEGSM